MTTETEIVLYLQHARQALKDGSGVQPGGLVYQERPGGVVSGQWVTRVADWTGVGQPESVERAEFVAKAIRRVEAKFGITAWYYDGYRTTSLKPKPNSKPKPCWTLCQDTVHGDGYGSSHTCARPVPEGELRCGIHSAAQRKRAATRERWAQESTERQERYSRDRARTAELRELWSTVCDLYSVEPERAGEPRVDRSTAMVDAELLTRFLRTLIERTDP